MIACICGGVLEVLGIVGLATIVGSFWGWIINRKPCCKHECGLDDRPKP